VPALGAYDPRTGAVIERHARWIADGNAQNYARDLLYLIENFSFMVNPGFDGIVQRDVPPGKRGFSLVYVNSFNEWHEGHQFERMNNRAGPSDAERAPGYDNGDRGHVPARCASRSGRRITQSLKEMQSC
jgi:hypothetical protein